MQNQLASSVQTDDPEGRSIVVESVRMVFFEIELEVADDVEGADLEAGPILIDLPMDGSVTTVFIEDSFEAFEDSQENDD